MNIWVVSREYAGIAEAGGVKNVTCSLSENLVTLGHTVTLFIPLYQCTDLSKVQAFSCMWHEPVTFLLQQKKVIISFSHGILNGVQIVFIGNKAFSEKHGVYTYTDEEERENPSHKHGHGHEDAAFLNTLFQKAVIAYGDTCAQNESPHIIHGQDATAALVPSFLRYKCSVDPHSQLFYAHTHCVVTIHNAGPGYHHEFSSLDEASYCTGLPKETLLKGQNGNVIEPFLLAAKAHAHLTTVSPQYAAEIMTGTTDTAGLSEAFSRNGISIKGITNGIDFSRYDPTDTNVSLLPVAFNPQTRDLAGKSACRTIFIEQYAQNKALSQPAEGVLRYGFLKEDKPCTKAVQEQDETVYIVYQGRVVSQKGISVLAEAADVLLGEYDNVRFIFMGHGQAELENEIISLCQNHPGRCVFFRGYDRKLVRMGIASADFSVFPSFFEPCGLTDLISQIYGTVPVAHATGGLQKIVNEETGFLYAPNTSDALVDILRSLIVIKSRTHGAIFTPLISYAATSVQEHFSWLTVARQYVLLYESIVKS